MYKPFLRVLRVHIDPQLKWTEHVAKVSPPHVPDLRQASQLTTVPRSRLMFRK